MENNRQQNNSKPDSRYRDDLPDSERDEERLQPENTVIDMPDVEDIPGQKFIHVPKLGEMADTTISSADEEGDSIWNDDDIDLDDVTLVPGDDDDDVSPRERDTLSRTDMDMPGEDNTNLRLAALDQYDAEGVPLNEGSSNTAIGGGDLDTTIVMNDNAMEEIGEEDEENNTYSLGGDDNENLEDSTNG